MPMDFPDMKSLISAARVHGFRSPENGEPEEKYRNALADHVESRDFIESEEIRNGCGWDKFSEDHFKNMLKRKNINPYPDGHYRNPIK